MLRSDNAKDYMSKLSQSFHETTQCSPSILCVDTPSQNGVAEKKNGHLLETARALLFQMKVPKQFWADAVSITCFLINRMPSSVLVGNMPIVFFSEQVFLPGGTYGFWNYMLRSRF